MTSINTYYIGLNDKDKHVQLYLTDTFIKLLQGILKAYNITCYSYNIIHGMYNNEHENTIELKLIDDFLINDCLLEIKNQFNQECILHTRIKADTNLI